MPTETIDYQDLNQFNYKLKAKMTSLSSTVAKRDDDESSFRDSFTVTANMGYELMHELLDSMGMSNTTFVDNLPDEAPTIALPGCTFEDHTLKITSGGKTVARMDRALLTKVVVTKDSDTTFEMTFIVKGVPVLSEHFNLERCILDCHAGSLFQFGFGSPAQDEMFPAQEGDGTVPSNLSVVE